MSASPPISLPRRGFLRGRSPQPAPFRPPWAQPEAQFLAACTRCEQCTQACPNSVLKHGDGGFPVIDFSHDGCSLCGRCVTACDSGALLRQSEQAPWHQHIAIDERCLARHGVECRVCGEICEQRALRFRPQLGSVAQVELDSSACTGCGACIAPCPTQAITMEKHA